MDLNDLKQIAECETARRRPVQIRVCTAAGCLALGSETVRQEIDSSLAEAGLADRAEVLSVGCLRLCSEGPLVRVDPESVLYERVTPAHGASIVQALDGGTAECPIGDLQSPFFSHQHSVVLENCGIVEHERIESYIARGGYQSLHRALHEMTPESIVSAVTRSGLRGRGGAGYPTGVKWATVAKTPPVPKFVVCNADEGDPGAFMDRSILESDPHRVLEGMAIAAYAIGADQGYIYVRGEYKLAIERLDVAISQARKQGLLGSQIFDSRFNFPNRSSNRCRRIRLWRGNRSARLDRRQARHSPSSPSISGRVGSLGPSYTDQQRGDFRQRSGHHPQGC